MSIPALNVLVGAILPARMAKGRGAYHHSKYDRAVGTAVAWWRPGRVGGCRTGQDD
ncbi:hypothetical protein ACFXDH_51075 [Streptomyces sp. NPDC059467]|uniref:hypothetical protein n=1 Tax=Streptomyces sp. NPDC059467 TaxID=3346844 RepID=UPI0036759FE0